VTDWEVRSLLDQLREERNELDLAISKLERMDAGRHSDSSDSGIISDESSNRGGPRDTPPIQ
jgi:hypothetical protein